MKTYRDLLSRGDVWLAHSAPSHSRTEEKKIFFGIPEIDSATGGIPFGAVHEWGVDRHPPFFILGSLLRRAIEGDRGYIAWVGRWCWPTPSLLEQSFGELTWRWRERSLFLHPETKNDRLWTITQLLASPAILGVIADGRGLKLVATRRLKLTAHRSNALAFLVRGSDELSSLSAAQTKWRISSVPSQDDLVQWKLELVRARGLTDSLSWNVAWDYVPGKENPLYLSPELVDRSAQETLERQAS